MSDRADQAQFALLADGTTVEIRQARPSDAARVQAMHERLSPENSYFRFFSYSPLAPEREARRLTRPPGPDHAALLAFLSGELVGVASCEAGGQPGTAEIAFAVADEMHGRGIATLLLDHLVSLARQRHLTSFTAETLPENAPMLRVFAEAGLAVQRRFADGVVEVTLPLPGPESGQYDSYLDKVAGRASVADIASLRAVLQPASIAVIGASRHRGSVGREILHSLVAGGYGGAVYPVNPRGGYAAGLAALTSPAELPEGVDVAVIAVPAAEVAGVAEQCGRRGVHALAVISAGLGDSGADLLAICRRYGMRLVGPNCYGIAVPSLQLNASFAAAAPAAGHAGLVVQSGGIGLALLEHLSRLGIGVSSFLSAGDKYDVSGNDMLTWWEQDGQTRLAILYLESYGNPRGFARTARRVGRAFPVLTVVSGRSPAGRRAAESRTAAGALPPDSQQALVNQEALFGQAGVIATRSLGELVEAAAFLSAQPLPAGPRVGIVTNAGGAGALAADACAEAGLTVATLSPEARQLLGRLLPSRSSARGPVDATGAVGPDAFRACLEQVAADDTTDALLAIAVPTAVADLTEAILSADVSGKPLAAALPGQPESVRILRQVPAYGYPENAARALARAAAYARWRDTPAGHVPELAEAGTDAARELVAGFLAGEPAGGPLPEAEAAALLRCYQIEAAPGPAAGVELAVSVRQDPVFGPVVVLGVGGPAPDAPGERVARLAPLTDADAEAMIAGVRVAPQLRGEAGSPAADTAALAGLLLRVSRLADDLPEVAELDLSPVIAAPDGVTAARLRVLAAPAVPRDPFLRRLR